MQLYYFSIVALDQVDRKWPGYASLARQGSRQTCCKHPRLFFFLLNGSVYLRACAIIDLTSNWWISVWHEVGARHEQGSLSADRLRHTEKPTNVIFN